MTTSKHRRVAIACVVLISAAACGDDSGENSVDSSGSTAAIAPNPTADADQGPNPTTDDPGPNDTSGGPETVQGLLVLDTQQRCVSIDLGTDLIAPDFVGYGYADVGDRPALVDDEGVPIARAGDSIIVAGFRAGGDGPCGANFDVESLVNVTPNR